MISGFWEHLGIAVIVSVSFSIFVYLSILVVDRIRFLFGVEKIRLLQRSMLMAMLFTVGLWVYSFVVQPVSLMDCLGSFGDLNRNIGWFGMLWFVTVLIGSVKDVLQTLAANSSLRKLKRCDDQKVLTEVRAVQARVGIEKPIAIFISQDETPPFSYGVFQHRIVVPARVLDDKNLFCSVIGHELQHIVSNDSMWNLLELILRRIFFFNPLAYLAAGVLSRTQEMWADKKTVEKLGVSPAEYIQSLISVAERLAFQSNVPLKNSYTSSFKILRLRIESLASTQVFKARYAYVAMILFFISFGSATLQANNYLHQLEEFSSEAPLCINYEKAFETIFHLKVQKPRCDKE